MIKLFVSLLFLSISAQAGELNASWEKTDFPNLLASWRKRSGDAYITVAHLDSEMEMSLAGQSEKNIQQTLTLLRRASLEPMGIRNWAISKLQKENKMGIPVVSLEGTYIGISGQMNQFTEKLYFKKKQIVQLSIVHLNSEKGVAEDRKDLEILEEKFL